MNAVAVSAEFRDRVLRNEPMSRHTSWHVGGPADIWFSPRDVEDLSSFLRDLATEVPVTWVGLGSNLLVRDGGLEGTAIFTHWSLREVALVSSGEAQGEVSVQAGVPGPKVARYAALQNLVGAEFLAGIPGTIGGALAMNAGCYGGETWDIVERAVTIDRRGEVRTRARDEFDIGYRHCQLHDGGHIGTDIWFAGAWFDLRKGDADASRATIRELLERRVASQPLSLPNAGSVFRNPPGDHAARLIESCGLKGLERGGARVSEKHANFIVNPKGRALAGDIEWLIEQVRARVLERTGVALVPEVRIVGERA